MVPRVSLFAIEWPLFPCSIETQTHRFRLARKAKFLHNGNYNSRCSSLIRILLALVRRHKPRLRFGSNLRSVTFGFSFAPISFAQVQPSAPFSWVRQACKRLIRPQLKGATSVTVYACCGLPVFRTSVRMTHVRGREVIICIMQNLCALVPSVFRARTGFHRGCVR